MSEIKLFIDTGDESYIKNIWEDFLSKGLTGKEIVGITTNPNAMSKCNVNTLQEFESKTRTLCKLISNIRKDDLGVVYVQHPDSNVSCEDLDKWISTILKFSDGQTKVGLKIPPYQNLLQKIDEYRGIIDFNVTGVADCSTALYCFTYLPRYVSLIPGRMAEVGIDASEHMGFIDQRKERKKSELITGSMRTIEGLSLSIKYNTVPTIGTRVFDLLIQNDISSFIKLWEFETPNDYIKFSPHVDARSTDLSISFFNQMDQMGNQLKLNLK
jgi:hypothetical protein